MALWQSLRRTTPTIAPIAHRSLLSVTGPQCSEFLNGLLSTAVQHPPKNHFSALLHAQGRVMYDVFLYATPTKDGYILEYDSRAPPTVNALENSVPTLQSYLRRHILRSKVKLRDVTPEFDVWASWGSPADLEFETEAGPRRWIWERSGVVEPDWSHEKLWPWGTTDGVILDRRGVFMGRRLLVRKGDKPREANTHDIVPTEEYTLHRILLGVPEGTQDLTPVHAFPMECNLDVMGGLDFRKGCYVGQELTVRTYHTGVIRKRIIPVEIIPPEQVLPNTWTPIPTNVDIKPIPIPSHQNDSPGPRPRGTGKLLSTHLINNLGVTGGVGLALLRLDHVSAWEKGGLKLEFETDSGNGKKWEVRPWLPEWWRSRPVRGLVDSR